MGRSSSRTDPRSTIAALLLLAGGLVISSGGRIGAAERAPAAGEILEPLLTTTELLVGDNRVAFGLLRDGQLVDDATVAVRVFDIRGDVAQLTAARPAVYYPLKVMERGSHVHVHPDGTRHLHDTATDVRGIYVAHVPFGSPGAWGLEIVARRGDGPSATARLHVTALDAPRAPAPGMQAPRSRNLIASDVGDLRAIDSSDPPDPRLHQTRIADAVAAGRPQLIVFATPRYCASRVCGPVLDVARTLIPSFGDQVAFIHQEIWHGAPGREFAPTVEEWGLRSEPWIFLVDGRGVVRARFEGLTTRRGLETALRRMLGSE